MAKKYRKTREKHNIEFMIIGLFILFAIIISVEQYISWGSFFELKDIHHEMFIVMFLFGALSITLLFLIKKRRR